MVVTLAHLAGIGVVSLCRPPGQVVVEVLTVVTVQTLCVVVTHTVTMDHALCAYMYPIDRGTLGGMSVAEAVAADDHVEEGVIVFLCDLVSGVQQVVTQCVELTKLDTQVSDLQHVLYPGTVRVFNLKRWVQHPEYHLSLCGRLYVRVARVTDDVVHFDHGSHGYPREGGLTVVAIVTVHLPLLPKIHGTLNHHGSRTECLKGHDEMCEVELSFQVQLNGHILHTILRLPPGLEAVGGKGGDQVFDAVAGGVVHPLIILLPGVTHKTLLLLLQVTNNAKAFRLLNAAGGGGGELVRTADQKVPGGGVAAPLSANIPKLRQLRKGPPPEGQK